MFLQLEVTPFTDDQFVFAGFTYFIDNMMMSQPQLFLHTQAMQQEHSTKLEGIKSTYKYLKGLVQKKWKNLKRLSFLRKQDKFSH